MKRGKNNLITNPTRELGDFTRQDKKALIGAIKGMMDHLDYVSVSVFMESTERVAAAFALGRQIPKGDPTFNEIVSDLVRFATRSKAPECKWFEEWVKKVRHHRGERLPSREGILAQIAHHIYPKVTVELDGFGFASASEMGPEIHIGSMAGFFHVFDSEYEARVFALSLLEAVNEIERSRSVLKPTAVPEDYEDTAVSDWQAQIIADAWLIRKDSEEDGDK